ncbi:hypothetical protein Shyhy02_21570 [Streptomyces hygroscopicus subsp. hygroscopicus]|nr:hypothetical protein Shyhy02_21570 [Streptomyces hygroscopicus subsp. hygroscopicus]
MDGKVNEVADTARVLRTIARNVRAARVRAALSQAELSRRSQVSKGTLVALENMQGNPSLATLVRLADALGLAVSALLRGARAGGCGRTRNTPARRIGPESWRPSASPPVV